MEMLDKAIANAFNDGIVQRGFDALVEEIQSPARSVLETSMDMNAVVHARGVIQGLKSLSLNIEKLKEKYDE